jgi:hypothetical protein
LPKKTKRKPKKAKAKKKAVKRKVKRAKPAARPPAPPVETMPEPPLASISGTQPTDAEAGVEPTQPPV